MTIGDYAIEHGDVLTVLRGLPDNSFDALLSDPPYGLAFMGKRWDYNVPSVEVWREALRVLKPGAALLAFGGTRTFHRQAVNIEDAGFELRDCLSWMYGKGFPKSLNVGLAIDKAKGVKTLGVSKASGRASSLDAQQWDGYGTALKPGWEPIILGRKPLEGTVVENVERWGTGALAIDDCRIEGVGNVRWVTPRGGIWKTDSRATSELVPAEGRWPANVALTHDPDCRITPNGEGCVSDCPIYMLDRQAGSRKSTPFKENVAEGNVLPLKKRSAGRYSDSGGPSRFFYSAKVSTSEREAGCENLPMRSAGECTDREDDSVGLDSPRAGAGRGGGARNHHPTLKPIELNRWLASLIRPPRTDAAILVPYSGAGSEMIGALLAGWGLVFGIEAEADYMQIAHNRIAYWTRGVT